MDSNNSNKHNNNENNNHNNMNNYDSNKQCFVLSELAKRYDVSKTEIRRIILKDEYQNYVQCQKVNGHETIDHIKEYSSFT